MKTIGLEKTLNLTCGQPDMTRARTPSTTPSNTTHTNAHERTRTHTMTMILDDPKWDYCKEELLEPYDDSQDIDEIRELFMRSRDLYVDHRNCEPSPLLHKVLCHLQMEEMRFVDNFPHPIACPACRKYYSVKMIVRQHMQSCKKVNCRLEDALLQSGLTLEAMARGQSKWDEGYVEDCGDVPKEYLYHEYNKLLPEQEVIFK